MANGHGGQRPGAGRPRGSKGKDATLAKAAAKAYALSIVEDPEVQAMMLAQAKAGQLASPIFQVLMYYAWGKPMERIEHSGDPDKPVVVRIRRAH